MRVMVTASIIVRLALVAVLIMGPLGSPFYAVGDHGGMDGVHYALSAPEHDCCDPGPVFLDRTCALGCMQAPCGPTALPIPAGWPAIADYLAVWWMVATALQAGITPDPATPPPRS
ncbi:hypothetical protein [Microvirga massiliensis]|uniref:hypothetical protein n=1 Tax=Microvirga massiliensis TaxID=1033741 RepID=UPI00065F87C6|nr:hypothetical protein [Microvirga massiliensis]